MVKTMKEKDVNEETIKKADEVKAVKLEKKKIETSVKNEEPFLKQARALHGLSIFF